jgi:hypothetical protein
VRDLRVGGGGGKMTEVYSLVSSGAFSQSYVRSKDDKAFTVYTHYPTHLAIY